MSVAYTPDYDNNLTYQEMVKDHPELAEVLASPEPAQSNLPLSVRNLAPHKAKQLLRAVRRRIVRLERQLEPLNDRIRCLHGIENDRSDANPVTPMGHHISIRVAKIEYGLLDQRRRPLRSQLGSLQSLENDLLEHPANIFEGIKRELQGPRGAEQRKARRAATHARSNIGKINRNVRQRFKVAQREALLDGHAGTMVEPGFNLGDYEQDVRDGMAFDRAATDEAKAATQIDAAEQARVATIIAAGEARWQAFQEIVARDWNEFSPFVDPEAERIRGELLHSGIGNGWDDEGANKGRRASANATLKAKRIYQNEKRAEA